MTKMNYCPNCGYHLNGGYIVPNYAPKWPVVPTPIPVWCVDKGNYTITTNNVGATDGTKTSTKG